MKVFQISSGCYSDTCVEFISHEGDVTNAEFKEHCLSATAEVNTIEDRWVNLELIRETLISRYGYVDYRMPDCHAYDYSYPDEEVEFTVLRNGTSICEDF